MVRSRDTMVVFEQWLLSREGGVPLARAEITCLCLDEASGKMVAAPLRLRE